MRNITRWAVLIVDSHIRQDKFQGELAKKYTKNVKTIVVCGDIVLITKLDFKKNVIFCLLDGYL